jgi:tetratricopeptide (TPR) repeat protein
MRDRVFTGKTTLLFGGSGVGKTSFLRAKLIPALESECRVYYHNQWAAVKPLQALSNSMRSTGTGPAEVAADTSPGAVATAEANPGLINLFMQCERCILVLDQFEEAFQNYAGESYFEDFLDELCEVINASKPHVWVLFSMREEFLGELSVFDNRIPDLFSSYYRLKHPNAEDALEIIERTCALVGVETVGSKVDQLIEDLAKSNRPTSSVYHEAGSASIKSRWRDSVSPTYLQLVCRQLWEEQTAGGSMTLFPAAYQPGQAAKILRTFCREKLSALCEEEKKVIVRALGFLISRRGAKTSYELDTLALQISIRPDQLKRALDRLVEEDTRILRRRPTPDGSIWYELYHDMYARILYEWKEEFEAELRVRQEEQEQRSREMVEAAAPLVSATVAIYENSLSPGHPGLVGSLTTLAVLVERQGHYAEAERLLQRVLSLQEKQNVVEPEAATLTNLARVILLVPSNGFNRLQEAEGLLRRALQIREQTLGPDHVEVGIVMARLASLLQQRHQYEEAEKILRRALAIQEKQMGGENLEVIANLNNLAVLLRQQGRDEEARSLSVRANEARKRSRDSDLEQWIRNKAKEISYDRKFRRLLAPVEDLLKMVPSTPQERETDWTHACTLLAAEVLDGRISFARDINASSYWRLEEACWLQNVKTSKAYVIWMHRGGGVDPAREAEDYAEACDQIQEKLLDPASKAAVAEFAPVGEYLNARYLNNGRLDRAKSHSKRMIEVKASHFGEVDPAGDLENWRRAEQYAEQFYENIIPAVSQDSVDHIRSVLDALRVRDAHNRKADPIVNCFEMAIAIYFLNPAIVKDILAD